MAIKGLPKCSSFIPLARHKLLAPAILLPCVVVLLRNGICILFYLFLSVYLLKKPFPNLRKACEYFFNSLHNLALLSVSKNDNDED
jgi:hypothetical protein